MGVTTIYFGGDMSKGTRETKLCDHPPSIVHLVEPVNAGSRHRLIKPLSPTVTGA